MAKGPSLTCETQELARAGPYRLRFQRDPSHGGRNQGREKPPFLSKVPKELGQKSPETTKLETKNCRTMELRKQPRSTSKRKQ